MRSFIDMMKQKLISFQEPCQSASVLTQTGRSDSSMAEKSEFFSCLSCCCVILMTLQVLRYIKSAVSTQKDLGALLLPLLSVKTKGEFEDKQSLLTLQQSPIISSVGIDELGLLCIVGTLMAQYFPQKPLNESQLRFF